jgi:hypothetical protein
MLTTRGKLQAFCPDAAARSRWRRDLEGHRRDHGCEAIREGANHAIGSR